MGIWLKKRDFKPYYKNQSSKEKRIAHLLKTTKLSYAKIGKKLRVSDHSVTDTNKKFKIRQRKPKLSLFRPTNETWKANRGAEIGRTKTKLKKNIAPKRYIEKKHGSKNADLVSIGKTSRGTHIIVSKRNIDAAVKEGIKRQGRPKIRRKTERN